VKIKQDPFTLKVGDDFVIGNRKKAKIVKIDSHGHYSPLIVGSTPYRLIWCENFSYPFYVLQQMELEEPVWCQRHETL
jgi:hypothetical protein